MTYIFGSIQSMLSKLFYLALSAVLGTIAAVLLPVLALGAFAYVQHTGDIESLRMLNAAMVVLGPLSSAFWFSMIWKNFRKSEGGFVQGLIGAGFRIFVGIVLSVGCLILATFYYTPKNPADSFAVLFLVVYAPLALLTVIKVLLLMRGPECVCNGEKCFKENCDGTIRRGFCTDCKLDMTVVPA